MRALTRADQAADGAILAEMTSDAIYEMALVFMMRLVFLLYGEENLLLPHGEVLYDHSYGVTHLWTELSQQHQRDADSMPRTFDAYPRLLATFRLIHDGCDHPDLSLLPYGGRLFDPARFPALEQPRLRVSNEVIYRILRRLLFARAKLGRRYVPQRVSYRALDVEQLGSVYEGLIDGAVKRAEEVMVTIGSGDEPVVVLSELEAREGDDLADYLRQVSGMSRKRAERLTEAAAEPQDDLLSQVADEAEHLDAEAIARIAPHADFLDIGATALPGDLYVVQQSGARKAGGQYYTPKWITGFIVERTLEPLVYEGEGGERRVKLPREILELNVCDPAMGSGAFLVQACRYLAERLVESWELIESENHSGRPLTLPYGVDINRLAVELAKMSLWLITLSRDRPFTFLDHRLKQGNSIIGAWAHDIDKYPAKAWDRKADDNALKQALKEIKKQVREQQKQREKSARGGQTDFAARVPEVREQAARALREIERVHTLDPGEKERQYQAALQRNERYRAIRRMYDACCALWFWPVLRDDDGEGIRAEPPSDLPLVWAYPELQEHLQRGSEAPVLKFVTRDRLQQWEQTLEHLQEEIQFFHWELEFPDVFERGSFDAIAMNPPWERVKLQEKEFFAARDQEIASAPNKAARERLIGRLKDRNPALLREFQRELHVAEAQGHFLRRSGRYPLTGRGDVNTYAVFAELSRSLVGPPGRAGLILPAGIATDDTTKLFFGDLMASKSLVSMLGMDNEAMIFPGIDHRNTFAIVLVGGTQVNVQQPIFTFRCSRPLDLRRPERRFALSDDDIALLNPNTRTCPVFRTRADAELTKSIYRRMSVLVNEAAGEDPWDVRFLTMFHMANDSALFSTDPGPELVPLYEGKMFFHFDHRYGTYEEATEHRSAAALPRLEPEQRRNPGCLNLPYYWAPRVEVQSRLKEWGRGWLLAFRDITSSPLERTAIFCLLPRVGVGHTAPILFLGCAPQGSLAAAFVGDADSLVFDYVTRQKLGGTHLTYTLLKQLPVLPPNVYPVADLLFIVPRVVELTCTAWDIKAFSDDVWREGHDALRQALERQWEANRSETGGHTWDPPEWTEIADDGCPLPPFKWSEDRRAALKAELDAYYARLYGLSRKQLRYILDPHGLSERELADILDPWEAPTCCGPHLLPSEPALDFPGETFRVLKEKQEREFGEYRTRRLVLEAWERLSSVAG